MRELRTRSSKQRFHVIACAYDRTPKLGYETVRAYYTHPGFLEEQ